MTSNAAATFTVKGLHASNPIQDVDVAIATVIKKRVDDATLTFAFTDATLKDPKNGQGVYLGAEKPLSSGLKVNLIYDVAKRSGTGSLTRALSFSNGSSLELKATYRQAGDVFVLDEIWKLDSRNKIVGHYNFATEEAIFGYTHTKGDWSATGRYNFQKEASTVEAEKRHGKHTFVAAYAIKDEAVALSWRLKPFRATLKGKAGPGGVSAQAAMLTFTHEFEV